VESWGKGETTNCPTQLSLREFKSLIYSMRPAGIFRGFGRPPPTPPQDTQKAGFQSLFSSSPILPQQGTLAPPSWKTGPSPPGLQAQVLSSGSKAESREVCVPTPCSPGPGRDGSHSTFLSVTLKRVSLENSPAQLRGWGQRSGRPKEASMVSCRSGKGELSEGSRAVSSLRDY
jgi:hypothetical protein